MPELRATNETLLAFDVGTRRIGVAVGNDLLRKARAVATLHVSDSNDGLDTVAALVAEWMPQRLVVGIPYPDGDAHGVPQAGTESARRCERFAKRLEARFHLPVERVDERFSSIDAESLHRERRQAGLSRRAKALDHLAAQVILQRYFDALAARAVHAA